MKFDLLSLISRAAGDAVAREPRASTVPLDEVVSTFIAIGLHLGKMHGMRDLVAILVSHIAVLESDEEKAVAVVRHVYASIRKNSAAHAAGAN